MRSSFYKFTSKKQSMKGIMATVLGTIAIISFIVVNLQAFKLKGMATDRMGAVGFLSIVFALIGAVLGLLSLGEKEKFMLFPRLGLALCLLGFAAWLFVVLIGVGVLSV